VVGAHGGPSRETSFGNAFRDWCDQSGLPQCSAHGLRKAGATIASDNGATTDQLMASYGWETLRQAELYTKTANRIRWRGTPCTCSCRRRTNRARRVSHLSFDTKGATFSEGQALDNVTFGKRVVPRDGITKSRQFKALLEGGTIVTPSVYRGVAAKIVPPIIACLLREFSPTAISTGTRNSSHRAMALATSPRRPSRLAAFKRTSAQRASAPDWRRHR
jgi:hypothetical protein